MCVYYLYTILFHLNKGISTCDIIEIDVVCTCRNRDVSAATRKFDEKKGMEIGMEKGMAKEKIATAYRLLSMGLSDEQVSTATELPLEEIQKMKE